MGEVIIQTSGLTKRYGEKTAVNQLNLSIKKGEIFGLLGPHHNDPDASGTDRTECRYSCDLRDGLYQKRPWHQEDCWISAG